MKENRLSKIFLMVKVCLLMIGSYIALQLLGGLLSKVMNIFGIKYIVWQMIIGFGTISLIVVFIRAKVLNNKRESKRTDFIKCITIDIIPMILLWIVVIIHYYRYKGIIFYNNPFFDVNVADISYLGIVGLVNLFISALYEEISFRFMPIEYLIKKQGKVYKYQVVTISLIFGIAHACNYFLGYTDLISQSIVQILFSFLMGMITCVLYIFRGKSILAVTIIHFAWNTSMLFCDAMNYYRGEKLANYIKCIEIVYVLYFIVYKEAKINKLKLDESNVIEETEKTME